MITETVKGFNDYTGQEAIKREAIREILVKNFRLFGFEPAETPKTVLSKALVPSSVTISAAQPEISVSNVPFETVFTAYVELLIEMMKRINIVYKLIKNFCLNLYL